MPCLHLTKTKRNCVGSGAPDLTQDSIAYELDDPESRAPKMRFCHQYRDHIEVLATACPQADESPSPRAVQITVHDHG